MTCETCLNKDICKFYGELDRIADKIDGIDREQKKGSPVRIALNCKHHILIQQPGHKQTYDLRNQLNNGGSGYNSRNIDNDIYNVVYKVGNKHEI